MDKTEHMLMRERQATVLKLKKSKGVIGATSPALYEAAVRGDVNFVRHGLSEAVREARSPPFAAFPCSARVTPHVRARAIGAHEHH